MEAGHPAPVKPSAEQIPGQSRVTRERAKALLDPLPTETAVSPGFTAFSGLVRRGLRDTETGDDDTRAEEAGSLRGALRTELSVATCDRGHCPRGDPVHAGPRGAHPRTRGGPPAPAEASGDRQEWTGGWTWLAPRTDQEDLFLAPTLGRASPPEGEQVFLAFPFYGCENSGSEKLAT